MTSKTTIHNCDNWEIQTDANPWTAWQAIVVNTASTVVNNLWQTNRIEDINTSPEVATLENDIQTLWLMLQEVIRKIEEEVSTSNPEQKKSSLLQKLLKRSSREKELSDDDKFLEAYAKALEEWRLYMQIWFLLTRIQKLNEIFEYWEISRIYNIFLQILFDGRIILDKLFRSQISFYEQGEEYTFEFGPEPRAIGIPDNAVAFYERMTRENRLT